MEGGGPLSSYSELEGAELFLDLEIDLDKAATQHSWVMHAGCGPKLGGLQVSKPWRVRATCDWSVI